MNDKQQDNALDADHISALADGQLRGAAFARTVERMAADGEARATWHAYHVVGEVLRSGPGSCTGDADFLTRLQARLAAEPMPARPGLPASVQTPDAIKRIANNDLATRTLGQNDAEKPAANTARFSWKLVAGFASVAAVAAIGWGVVGGLGGLDGGAAAPQLAQQSAPADSPGAAPRVAPVVARAAPVAADTAPLVQQALTVAGQPQVMIRDPRIDELMAAHKQFGGTSALQMPAGFLRNATFEGPAR